MSSDLFNTLELTSSDFLLFTNRHFISHPFVFDYLLQSYAKKGVQIVAVLLANNWSHYRSVAAKCAINLSALKDKDQIQVIDFLAENKNFDFNDFLDEILRRLTCLPSDSVVLIDDISLLLTLGEDFVKIYRFVHKLQVICRQKCITLAIGSHYPSEEDDEELNRFVISLAHKCDILCQIDKTSSGYSPLVSGYLQIDRRHQNSRKQFNYRISDRSVKLLPLGSQLF